MKISLCNQLDSFEKYLKLRKQIPYQLRLEAVFSFNCWADVEGTGWLQDPQKTHGEVVKIFLKSAAIDLLHIDIFRKQVQSPCQE